MTKKVNAISAKLRDGLLAPVSIAVTLLITSTPVSVTREGPVTEILSVSLGSSTGFLPEPVISPSGGLAVIFEVALIDVPHSSGTRSEERAVSALVIDLTEPNRRATVSLESLPWGSATARFNADESTVFIGSSDLREFGRFVVFDTGSFSVTGDTYVLQSFSDALALSPVGPWYTEILFYPAARGVIVSSLETGDIVAGSIGEGPPSPWFSKSNDRFISPGVKSGEKDVFVGSFFGRANDIEVSLAGKINGYAADILAETDSGSLLVVSVSEAAQRIGPERPPVIDVVFVDLVTQDIRGRVPSQFIDQLEILGFSPDERFAIHRVPAEDGPFTGAESLAIIDIDHGDATVWNNAPEIAWTAHGQSSIFSVSQTGESFVIGLDAIRFIDWELQRVTREILLEPPITEPGSILGSGQGVYVPETNELILPWVYLKYNPDESRDVSSPAPDQGALSFIFQRIALDAGDSPTPFFISGDQLAFDRTGQRAFILRSSQGAVEVWNMETRRIEKFHRLDNALAQVNFDQPQDESVNTYRVLSQINYSHLPVSADGSSVYVIAEEHPISRDDEDAASMFHLYSVNADTGEQTLIFSRSGTPLQAGLSADGSTLFASVTYDDPAKRAEFLVINLNTGSTVSTQLSSELTNGYTHEQIANLVGGDGVVSAGTSILLHDSSTGRTRATTSLPPGEVRGLVISPVGTHVISITGGPAGQGGTYLHTLTLTETGGGGSLGEFRLLTSVDPTSSVTAGFHPDGRRVYVLSDSTLTEYDLSTGAALRELPTALALPETLVPTRMVVSPDGETVWALYTREPDRLQSFFVPLGIKSSDWVVLADPQSSEETTLNGTEAESPVLWPLAVGGLIVITCALATILWWARRRQRLSMRTNGN